MIEQHMMMGCMLEVSRKWEDRVKGTSVWQKEGVGPGLSSDMGG
jgi:hypothetical protein